MNSAQHNIVNFQDKFQLCSQVCTSLQAAGHVLHEVCPGSVMNYRIYPYFILCLRFFFPFYFVCLFLCKDEFKIDFMFHYCKENTTDSPSARVQLFINEKLCHYLHFVLCHIY